MQPGVEVAGKDVKPWRVLHACETVGEAALLAEAQSGVGMHPQLLSREYWNPSAAPNQISLMNAWHDVRDWRHALNEAETLTSTQIIHAHSFASAMAGVRGTLPTVYDFEATLEEVARQQSQANSGPWLLRSLRVAEQFALSRASVVVTHSSAMKQVAHERGAATANVFAVPDPVVLDDKLADPRWTQAQGIKTQPETLVILWLDARGIDEHPHWLAATSQAQNMVLLVECNEAEREQMMRTARDARITNRTFCVPSSDRLQAIRCADLVVAPPTGNSLHANAGMLQAMAAGKTVLAAVAPENRECSQEGRGCFWFNPKNEADFRRGISSLTRDRQLAKLLGENGRAHIATTRAPEVIGRRYHEIYRFAQARRSEGSNPKIDMPRIYALGTQML